MYVRNQNTGRRVRPPDNYSGNAFDREGYRTSPDLQIPQNLLPSPPDIPPEGVDKGMPIPDIGGGGEEQYIDGFGASDRAHAPKECEEDESKCNSDCECRKEGGGLKSLLSSIMPPRTCSEGGEFGFEDMLIIGLIFLLSQSEGDEDILLALVLLLFYK